MKGQIFRISLSFFSTDDNTQYCHFHTWYYSKTVKQHFNFTSVKTMNFPVKNGKFDKQEETGTIKQKNCEKHPRSNLAQNLNVPRS